MDFLFSFISSINTKIQNFIWGPPMLIVFLAVGLLYSTSHGFFQIRHFPLWMKKTILSTFSSRKKQAASSDGISPFQSLCTALAGTMGTGNIAGVATAITTGGPGAVFWMWLSAFLGMMTHYGEIVLGMKYRRKTKNGEYTGGAFTYIEDGIGSKPLAMLFALFCILASLGIGNMTQVNSISTAMADSFSIPPLLTGAVVSILTGLVIIGGIKRIAAITEKVIPVISILYIVGALLVIAAHKEQLPAAINDIFQDAFSFSAAGGGVLGYGISRAIRTGISKGVFSNEAGLGSSVIAHAASREQEPVIQGMWGIFEVFADTIVMCTITALTILCSGVYDKQAYLVAMTLDHGTGSHFAALPNGVPLTSAAFSTVFGTFGSSFVSVSILLFAFSTLIGWSYYGERCVYYLFGPKLIPHYKLTFIYFVFLGALLNLNFVWNISDTFNGLMALPNLTALFLLHSQVRLATKDYFSRFPTKRKVSKKFNIFL